MHETTDPSTQHTPGFAHRVAMLADDMRALACDHLELAALEARNAGAELVRSLSMAVAISILFTTAWLAAIAGGIVWATAAGTPWSVALVIAACLNIAVGAALGLRIRGSVHEPLFAASLRQLRRDAGPATEDRT